MLNKHTPAPWNVEFSDDDPYGDILIRGNRRNIAKLWLDDAPVPAYNEQQKANAKLMASAPELLEALKEIVNCEINRRSDLETLSKRPNSLYTFSDARVKKAQAAITKAEGK